MDHQCYLSSVCTKRGFLIETLTEGVTVGSSSQRGVEGVTVGSSSQWGVCHSNFTKYVKYKD